MTKTLLVIGAGEYQLPGIIKAKKMGLKVISTDFNPNAIGFEHSDDHYVIDVKNKEENLKIAEKHNIDGVLSFATEIAVPTVAYIAEKLNLHGIRYEAAINATNKLKMRAIFKKHNVPSIKFFEITTLKTLFKVGNDLGYPFVFKPADSSGSRGVTIIYSIDEIADAFSRAMNYSISKKCIAEEFFEGIESTIEGFSYKGEHTVLAISQKKKPETKYRVAMELFYPPTFNKEIIKKIEKAVTDAVVALGINNGMTHSEVIVNDKGNLTIVEVAARGGGFGISNKIIEYITGFDPITALILLSIGEEIKIEAKTNNSAILKFYTPEPGIINKIEGKEKLNNIMNTEVEFFINEGEIVPLLTTDGSRTASIISWGKDRKQVQLQVDQVESAIKFRISPLPLPKTSYSKIKASKSMSIGTKVKALRDMKIDVIDFSWGEPCFDTPKRIIESAKEYLTSGYTHYTPGKGYFSLREKISKDIENRLNVSYDPIDEIIICSGGKIGIFYALSAFIQSGEEVLILEPYWLSYKEQVHLAGGVPIFIKSDPNTKFRLNIKELKEKISTKSKVLILNSPCNPTGVIFTKEELESINEIVQKNNLIVISDEVYRTITFEKDFISVAQVDNMKNHTIIVDSFSKSYAMTGWRIGYICAPRHLMDEIYKIHQHSSTCVADFVQMAALTALNECYNEPKRMCEAYKVKRDLLVSKAKGLGNIEIIEPEGTFYAMLKLQDLKYPDSLVSEILLEEYKVAVIPGSAYGESSSNYLRLCFAKPENEISKGLERISQFFKDYTKKSKE